MERQETSALLGELRRGRQVHGMQRSALGCMSSLMRSLMSRLTSSLTRDFGAPSLRSGWVHPASSSLMAVGSIILHGDGCNWLHQLCINVPKIKPSR
jgi:hypothetical protein